MIITDINKLQDSCEDISIFEAVNIINELEEELNRFPSGVGLAAPQIGKNKRVCIIRIGEPINLINPEIVNTYDIMEFIDEGCLSFPGQSILTKRYNKIMVKDSVYTVGRIFTGLEAVAVQHEIDHLNGNTMFDYQIKRPGRNELCWCEESGKKYKKCHDGKIIRI